MFELSSRDLRETKGFFRDLGHVVVNLAARQGFEPQLTDPKSVVLPLDDPPII